VSTGEACSVHVQSVILSRHKSDTAAVVLGGLDTRDDSTQDRVSIASNVPGAIGTSNLTCTRTNDSGGETQRAPAAWAAPVPPVPPMPSSPLPRVRSRFVCRAFNAGALHSCVSASAEPRELKFDDQIDEYSLSSPGVPPSGGSGWGVCSMPCSPAGSSLPVPGIVANADTATKTTMADNSGPMPVPPLHMG
jgi:hypothetical protein